MLIMLNKVAISVLINFASVLVKYKLLNTNIINIKIK